MTIRYHARGDKDLPTYLSSPNATRAGERTAQPGTLQDSKAQPLLLIRRFGTGHARAPRQMASRRRLP